MKSFTTSLWDNEELIKIFGKIPITITAIANGISIDFSLRFKSDISFNFSFSMLSKLFKVWKQLLLE